MCAETEVAPLAGTDAAGRGASDMTRVALASQHHARGLRAVHPFPDQRDAGLPPRPQQKRPADLPVLEVARDNQRNAVLALRPQRVA
jgi:hypothetical protein